MAATAAVCCHASAAASTSGTQGAAGSRPCSASRRGPGSPHRVPVRTASRPSGGPPKAAASATRTDPVPGGMPCGSRPSEAVASTSSGMPCPRHSASTSASGWRVPTSALADWSTAPATSPPASATAYAVRSTRPSPSTGTGSSTPGWSSTTERSVAPATTRGPVRRRAWRSPVRAELERRLRARVHRQLVGAHADRPGQHLARGVEQRAGPATGRVEPGGVGPRRVEGSGQGLCGHRVQRPPGGVEQPGRLRVEGRARHA